MAAVTDAIEGMIGAGAAALWFHYDITADVLYLRLASERTSETTGEETPQGVILLRRDADNKPVGLTVVDWWKRFGRGSLPDSLRELERSIEPWAARIAA